jgi:hypothetical protein
MCKGQTQAYGERVAKPTESDMETSLADARFFFEKLDVLVRGPEHQQNLELIRRYFRAYLHCWKCIPHFLREIRNLRNNQAWRAWCQKWSATLPPGDGEVFDGLRLIRDHDTHAGMIEVTGEVAAGLFPIVMFQPAKRSELRRELISCCARGLAVADRLIRDYRTVY